LIRRVIVVSLEFQRAWKGKARGGWEREAQSSFLPIPSPTCDRWWGEEQARPREKGKPKVAPDTLVERFFQRKRGMFSFDLTDKRKASVKEKAPTSYHREKTALRVNENTAGGRGGR
jgi:hypothetical protein